MENILDSVKIRKIPKEILIKETIRCKRNWKDEYFEDYEIDDLTLERWVVNYIRHNLVEYDETVNSLKGKVEKDHAYFVFKKGILGKIAEVYPDYAEECKRQMEFMPI